MIYNKEFIWTHIGRTGGYSVGKMFALLNRPDIHLDPINPEYSDWKRHQTFSQRAEEMPTGWLEGKTRILSFRRLPNWILSFAEYKKKYQNIPFTHEEMVQSILKAEKRATKDGQLDAGYRTFQPDDLLRYYEYETVQHWIRTEYLVDDVVRVFQPWIQTTDEEYAQLKDIFENGNNSYKKNITERFSDHEIRKMYASNPIWTEIERKLYGHLLVDIS